MNVLIIVDRFESAIWRLAKMVESHNPHLSVTVFPVHPKRNDAATLKNAQDLMNWADLIDIHYWRSGTVLKATFPKEFNEKPKVLCHYNPYDITKESWSEYGAVIVGNNGMHAAMPTSHLIPYAVDLTFFGFKDRVGESGGEGIVNMTVGRIEGKKGVLPVALACKKIGAKMQLVGRVSDSEYMQKILETGVVDFIEGATEQELRQAYYDATIHVCNSVDNFETGTLTILEAMACGTPVLTREIGHVPDLHNNKNMVVHHHDPEDVDSLAQEIELLLGNPVQRNKLAQEAWQTVKNRPAEKRASQFYSLYQKIAHPKHPLVSVIIPTKDGNPGEAIEAATKQDYPNMEIVIVDSGDNKIDGVIPAIRKLTHVPIKYITFPNNGEYTLPKARNMGVLNADGEILVFCDDRLKMAPDAVSQFVLRSFHRVWLWGVKDDAEKSFVENFSCVRRENLIAYGMFNERIDAYGGATQDIRNRFEEINGMIFEMVKEAKAYSDKKSGSKFSRRSDIVRSKYNLWRLYGRRI